MNFFRPGTDRDIPLDASSDDGKLAAIPSLCVLLACNCKLKFENMKRSCEFIIGSCCCYLAVDSFAANVVMSEGESIHDFCWYPYMSASGSYFNLRLLVSLSLLLDGEA